MKEIKKRKCLTQSVLEGISKILGDTGSGLTGSEIGYLLAFRRTNTEQIYGFFAAGHPFLTFLSHD
jgi:hypothetical protein